MARVFTITAASETVRLEAPKTEAPAPAKPARGQAAFTVTNVTDTPQGGRAVPVALGSTRKEWLTVPGEAAQDFLPHQADQFTVQIETPPGTPSGRYTFRLDVVSTRKLTTDDESAEGPTVAFEVPASEVVKKKIWPLILVIVAVLLIVGGVAVWLLRRNKGVPDLVGKTEADARAVLAQEQLTPGPGLKDSQPDKAAGIVLAQTPKAGDAIPDTKTVNLVVQAEPSPTPVPTSPAARFNGSWLNEDSNTRGVTRLDISNSGDTVTVHGFGACHPTDCDWGSRSATFTGEPFNILFDFGGGLTERLSLTISGDRLTAVDVGSRSGTNTYSFHRRRRPGTEVLDPHR